MPTPADISAQMVQTLGVIEPDLDANVGTPLRKILDTVSEAISEAYTDRYLLSYAYDIDNRSGSDLDAFCAIFGIGRFPARRSSGVVLFQRSAVAVSSGTISSGTQLATSDSPPIIFQTTAAAIFPQSSLSISIPVSSVAGGSISNVPSNSIIRMISLVSGVGVVSNPASMTGGTDAESDAQLRDRFKRTVFRNLAGTEDMYLGAALNDPNVSTAIVLGPSKRWRERIEVVAGSATSTITMLDRASYAITSVTNATPIVVNTQNAHGWKIDDIVRVSGVGGTTSANGTFRIKGIPSSASLTLRLLDDSGDAAGNGAYTSGGLISFVTRARSIFTSGYAFGADLDGGLILTPNVHYSIDTTQVPPTLTVLDTIGVPDGIYDLSINYAPINSRDDIPRGFSNRVDVWTSGNRTQTATESTVIDGAVVFSSVSTDRYYYGKFKRLDGTFPTAGSIFLPLGFKPVTIAPTTIVTGSYTIPLFSVVREIGVNFGSFQSLDGIEIPVGQIQDQQITILSSTNATPIVVTFNATEILKVGQRIKILNHTGNTAANGQWYLSAVTGTTATLTGSVGNGVGGATGTAQVYTPVTLTYNYNEIPRSVQQVIESYRMATTDILVHHGRQLNCVIYAMVILKPGYSVSSIQTTVNSVVAAFLGSLGFGSTMQVSDLLNVIANVVGVDAVRLTTGADAPVFTLTGATNTTPVVVTTTNPHTFVVNQLVIVDQIAGNTAANGTWIVSAVSTNTVTLTNSSGNGVYSSGGRIFSANFGVKIVEDNGFQPMMSLNSGAPLYRERDIEADDNEYFTLNSIVLIAKAQNTFGVS